MFIHIENLGEHGIVHDRRPRLLPANAWTKGRNVSTYAGNITSVRGYKSLLKTPTYAPYWLLPIYNEVDQEWIYAGWNGTSMVLRKITDTSTEVDVTRTSAAYTASVTDRWSGGVLGKVPVATNGVDEPQIWDSATSKFVNMSTITGWDSGDSCRLLVPHRNTLIAADITESGTRYASLLRWSNVADPGSFPQDWSYDDTTSLSGRVELAQTDDPIVEMVRMGEDLYIYKTRSVWRMTAVEGLWVWDFSSVFDTFGAAGKGCVVDTGRGSHVVFTGTDLKMHDGRQVKSLLTNRSRRRLSMMMDAGAKDYSTLIYDRAQDEILFCYPEQGQTWSNKAFIYNLETGDTGWRDLPQMTAAANGDIADYLSAGIWNTDTEVWNKDLTKWNELDREGTDNLILCSPSNMAFYGLNLGHDFDGENIFTYVERQDITLEGFSPDDVKTVIGLRPKIEVVGPYEIDIYIGTRMLEEEGVEWHGPYRFNPESGNKVDFRHSGRWISVRFSFRGRGQFSLSGYSLEIVGPSWQ